MEIDQRTKALDVFRSGLKHAKTFAATWSTRADWKGASGLYQEVCNTLKNLGCVEEAFMTAKECLAFLDQKENCSEDRRLQIAQALNNVAWYALLTKRFDHALLAAREANALAPQKIDMRLNLIHALALTGSVDEARDLQEKGRKVCQNSNSKWMSWLEDDLRELKQHAIDITPLLRIVEAWSRA